MVYTPKNGNIIVRQDMSETKTASGILIASEARTQKRTAIVIATDSSIVNVGDEIIADLSSGSYLETADDYSILSIPEDEVIAVVQKEENK